MLSDLLITIAGFFIFDIKTGLYSLLGLTIRSFMVDTFIENFNLSKYFNVVCDDPEPICDFIVHELKCQRLSRNGCLFRSGQSDRPDCAQPYPGCPPA